MDRRRRNNSSLGMSGLRAVLTTPDGALALMPRIELYEGLQNIVILGLPEKKFEHWI